MQSKLLSVLSKLTLIVVLFINESSKMCFQRYYDPFEGDAKTYSMLNLATVD